MGRLSDAALQAIEGGGRGGTRPSPARRRHGTDWPAPLATDAFHGPAGRFVATVGPHSESDPAALVVQLLAAFGNACGSASFYRVEGDVHPPALYVVAVGPSASARKGTSAGRVRELMKRADSDWAGQRILGGLSSGEGLIEAVRDAVVSVDAEGAEQVEDPGVSDKRLLVFEPEFARVLKVKGRENNILSTVVRELWDAGIARTMTKASPRSATGAHVSIIGHVTPDEIRRELTDTDAVNGFANRFLYVCVKRSKSLPFGGQLPADALDPIAGELTAALGSARAGRELTFDPAAAQRWANVYERLMTPPPGLLGAVTGRAAPQTIRLAVAYALLDCSSVIRDEHLRAALAIWDYCARSAKYVFGVKLGNRLADRLRAELRDAGEEGLTREAIRALVGGRTAAQDIDDALYLLADHGVAARVDEPTGGRPAERWKTVEVTEESPHEESALTLPYVSSTPPPQSGGTLAELVDSDRDAVLAAFPGSWRMHPDEPLPAGATTWDFTGRNGDGSAAGTL